MLVYAAVFVLGVLIGAISQVLLKKSAQRTYDSVVAEYLNPRVIGAYTLFVLTTFMTIYAYKGIPLSYGPILETSSYIFVTIFGVTIFHEKMGAKKIASLALIIVGIIIYSIGLPG